MKPSPLIASLAVLLCVVGILTGCNGKATADYRSHEVLRSPRTGAVIYERTTGAVSVQELPANAAGPTTQAVSEDGIGQTTAGTHEITAEQIVAQNGKLFYIAAVVFAGLAVVGFAVLKSPPLGIAAGIAAGACAATPIFLDQLGPWLLPIGGVLALAAIVWAIVNHRASVKASQTAGALLAEADAAAAVSPATALDKMRTATAVLAQAKPQFAKAARTAL